MCIRDSQCTDYKLNVVAFISEVLYVYYAIDNKGVVSMKTHRFPFSITHQRSFTNVRHVLINIFNVKTSMKSSLRLCNLTFAFCDSAPTRVVQNV